VEQDIAQYYAGRNPGQVQVLGVDLWNGTAAQLGNFKAVTGATYPLLQSGASATGGNVELLYGTYDNFVVLNKQRVVRYHAALAWPHGNRYHLDEIRGCVDSLVTNNVDVPPSHAAAVSLAAFPNPSRNGTRIAFRLPESVADAEVSVFDAAGRRCATLHQGPLSAGSHAWAWDARGPDGALVAPGLYLVRARRGAEAIERRVAVIR
jgi:hypothetical protein